MQTPHFSQNSNGKTITDNLQLLLQPLARVSLLYIEDNFHTGT
jgi:hypothetical protein